MVVTGPWETFAISGQVTHQISSDVRALGEDAPTNAHGKGHLVERGADRSMGQWGKHLMGPQINI